MSKEYLGKLRIPSDRMTWVISQLGKTFRSPFHAFRQYIDNAKDSIKIRKIHDPSFSEEDTLIKIELTRSKKRDDRKIRIIDFGVGITSDEPVWETPDGTILKDQDGNNIPYINSFENMQNNIANSVKKHNMEVTGEKAVGMLAFLKLNCKTLKFVSKLRSNGKVYTYVIDEELNCYREQGGDKKYDKPGTEVILEGMHKKTFDAYFNPGRLKLNLSKTYHQDLQNKIVQISVEYYVKDKRKTGKGRRRNEPFYIIKPMEIRGEQFKPTQIKTRSGERINLNIKVSKTPRKDPFIRINNRGTGGVPAETVLYNPIWENEYTQGFIEVKFLNFEGHDKSSFEQDEKLEEFTEALEEKVEPKLGEMVSDIKKQKSKKTIMDTVDILKYALARTIKNLDIRLDGTVSRVKTCPNCGKKLSYNHKVCPDCGYEFPPNLKKCRFCNSEIPSNSRICPECNKELMDKINCPECGESIPKLGRVCPECGKRLRPKRKEPKGKGPDILPQPLGAYNPRSVVEVEEEKLKVIQVNEDHADFQKALQEDYISIYMSLLASKEVSKYMYAEDKEDYSDELLEIFLNIFNELMLIDKIQYDE